MEIEISRVKGPSVHPSRLWDKGEAGDTKHTPGNIRQKTHLPQRRAEEESSGHLRWSSPLPGPGTGGTAYLSVTALSSSYSTVSWGSDDTLGSDDAQLDAIAEAWATSLFHERGTGLLD